MYEPDGRVRGSGGGRSDDISSSSSLSGDPTGQSVTHQGYSTAREGPRLLRRSLPPAMEPSPTVRDEYVRGEIARVVKEGEACGRLSEAPA